jgi:hypothetical protein
VVKVLVAHFELLVGVFDEVVEVEALEVVHFEVVVGALVEMLDVVTLEVASLVKVLKVD